MPASSRNFAGAPIKHYSEELYVNGVQPLNSGSKTSASTKIEIKTPQPTATHQRRLESPTDLAVKFITCNSAELVWSSPVFMAKHDVSYRVRYWPKKQHRALAKTLISQETYCRLEKLTPETPYMIDVVAISSDGQQTSEFSEIFEFTTAVLEHRFAEDVVQQCEKIATCNEMELYAVPLNKTIDWQFQVERFVFGKADSQSRAQHKSLLLMGERGSGKTTLINAMINYMFNVQWEDSFRFQLPEANDNKDRIKIYVIHRADGFRIPYSLSIIDTPGYLDNDLEISQVTRQFLIDPTVAPKLNMIGFVAKSSMPHMLETQLNILDSVLSIFGDVDAVKEKIRFLFTFADEQVPPVVNFLLESGPLVPANGVTGEPLYYKFNNSGVFCSNRQIDSRAHSRAIYNFNRSFWNLSSDNFQRLFNMLATM